MTARVYADNAGGYWRSGWRGILPLPPGEKNDPPKGFTGHDGIDPSWPDVQSWIDGQGRRFRAESNIALRLPDGVLGIDVDAYGDKVGGQTFARYEERLGALPATWTSTSRDDGVSGIRLYRVPEGRTFPERLTGGGVELIRWCHRYVVAAPSIHPDTGATYRWLRPDGLPSTVPPKPEELPELPEAWLSDLDRGAQGERRANVEVDEAEAKKWLADLPAGNPCQYVLARREKFREQMKEGRHDAALRPLLALLYSGLAGHPGVAQVVGEARKAWTAAVTTGKAARTDAEAKAEWRRALLGGIGRTKAEPPVFDPVLNPPGCTCPPPAVEPDADTPAGALDELLRCVRGYLHLPDARHVLVALAGAVSSADEREAEPLWLMLVGPPSGGKTEAIRLLDGVVDDRADELTVGGLLHWSKAAAGSKAPPKPSGLLVRVGARGMATVKDFSTVLATSDRGGREQLFSNLRAVYDGSLDRAIANPKDGAPLRWAGRLTLVAAVTPSIDEYASHGDALGPRWLYCRLPESTSGNRRAASRMARAGQLDDLRKHAAGLTTTLVQRAREQVTALELEEDVLELLDDAAVVTCFGRVAVPREPYGRRDISGVPTMEEPPRVVKQLGALTRALVALGLDTADAVAIARRCALDTVPKARRLVLSALAAAQGELVTVAEVSRRTGLHRHVVRRALEDLQTVGLTRCPEVDADDEDDPLVRGARHWHLDGDDADTVVEVMRAAEVERGGTRCGNTTPQPPSKDSPETQRHSDTETQSDPTLRATRREAAS